MVQKINVHLSKELYEKYGIKKFPVRKGDVVRIVRGDSKKDDKNNVKGKEGKILQVLREEGKLIIENINISKADGKMKPRKIDASNTILVKLNLDDKLRKEKILQLARSKNKEVEDLDEESIEEENQDKNQESKENKNAGEEVKENE